MTGDVDGRYPLLPILVFTVFAVFACIKDTTPDAPDAPDATSGIDTPVGSDSPAETDTTQPGTCPFLVADPVSSPTVKPSYNQDNAIVFDESGIREYHVTFTAEEWQKFEDAWRDEKWIMADDPQTPEEKEEADKLLTEWLFNKGDYYVHCTFEFEGEVFEDAACRLRGSPEDWYKESKPQMKIRFSKWTDGARFRGLRSVNLEYLRHMDAPVRDRLAMWFMRKAGLPASRSNHVHLFVKKDGPDSEEEDLGLYMNIEPVDVEFLADRFDDASGNLYKGGYIKKTNEDEENSCDVWALSDMIALEDNLPDGADHSEFFEALPHVIDVDQFLRVMAAEVLIQTKDNLANGSTNFYFYNNPGQNFVAVPWDLDVILSYHCGPDSDLFAYNEDESCTFSGALKRLMLANPEWKTMYEDHLTEFVDGPFADLATRTTEVCAQVREGFSKDTAWLVDHDLNDFDDDCAEMVKLIEDRVLYVKDVLGR